MFDHQFQWSHRSNLRQEPASRLADPPAKPQQSAWKPMPPWLHYKHDERQIQTWDYWILIGWFGSKFMVNMIHQLGGPDYPYLWWVCTGPRNPLSTKSTALGSCASGSRLSLKIRYTFYSTCFAKKIMIIHWVLGCPIFRLCTYWLYDRCDAKKNLSQLEMTNPGFIAAWNASCQRALVQFPRDH